MMTTASTRPKSTAPTADRAREADRLEHDVAKTGDLVRLDDFHYDRRARRLHRLDCTAGQRSVRLQPDRHKGASMVRRVAVAFALVAFIVPAAAQQRDRASIPEKYKWDLTHIYPSNAAWRAAKEKLEADIPRHSAVQGNARQIACGAGRRARACDGASKDVLQGRDVRQSAGRSGHAACGASGDAAGSDACSARHSARKRPSSSRRFFRSAATNFSSFCRRSRRLASYRFYSKRFSASGAHAERTRGTDSCQRRVGHRRAVHDVGSAAECGVSVSKRHAERRTHRQVGSTGVRRLSGSRRIAPIARK